MTHLWSHGAAKVVRRLEGVLDADEVPLCADAGRPWNGWVQQGAREVRSR